MKASDAIAEFIAKHVDHVFVVSGGANLHLLDSLSRTHVRITPTQNEQAASFAADAYSRLHGLGCAIATSGPGATNLVTGIATSFYDSVPVLFITGNQTRERLGIDLGVRQYGFQATPITEVVRPICKYAKQVMDTNEIQLELQMAVAIAKARRPGPVLLDFPDDVQRSIV